jgi:outer membrane receptor protein involved in Fe transport
MYGGAESMRARLALLGLAICLCLSSTSARADDVADEADVEFQLGAERYEHQDYRGALSHFLASNRLAQNRNVLFNIALCYEKLAKLPEAYRYYARSLDGESDGATRARIQASLAQLAPRVPLLHIISEPPGARLYLDRKDLGERGTAPQTLALAPGSYRVLAELEGFRIAESAPVELRVGVEHTVSLQLQRIVGTIHVLGPPGASLHLDDDQGPEVCRAPCDVPAPPGQHTLIASKAGYRAARLPVSVEADRASSLFADLLAESGSLVVRADETGATLEIDGLVRGSIPASFDTPVGAHRIRVSLRGFQPLERQVVIRANQQTILNLKLLPSDVVEAASRRKEPLEEAPASISLIGSQELRAMQYPTLAEALRGTRGVYLTDDRGYTSLGVRGLALPGSYGKRVLVTLDGMPTNDNWSWASFSGFDLRTDLDDIERIEVVRGPGSVIYGTSAFTGVVNLVTRSQDVANGVETGISALSDGVFRARARLTRHFDARSGVWTSIAGGSSEGRDFFFPEYIADGPPEVAGHARGLDGARFATLTGRAWWRDLSVAWSLNYHLKHLPTGQYEALLGDGRARQSDARGFVEARFEPTLGAGMTSLTRVHANLYQYRGYIPFSPDAGGLDTTHFDGYWFGLEQRFVLSPSPIWKASVGSELQAFPGAHSREASELKGPYLDDRQRLVLAAVYADLDLRPLPQLKLSAGARLDYYSSYGAALNPRVALIAQPYEGGNLKLLLGKAFIAPSVSESAYSYYDLISNPNLRPENLYSAELEWSQRLSPFVMATLAGYANYVTNLISLEELPRSADEAVQHQYRNARAAIGTLGAEAELRREWKQGWMLAGSASLQRSAYLRSHDLANVLTLERSADFRELPNSPTLLGSLKAAAPVLSRLLRVMTRLSFEGARHDRNVSARDSPQTHTQAALLWDFVFSGSEPRFQLDYSLGVYNALDSRAEVPVSSEFRQLSIPIAGRSLLASAGLSF